MDSNLLANLTNLIVDSKTLRVKNRESEHREFKVEFNNNELPRYIKTMVAFANRDGGILFFGIKDHPRELVGVEEKNNPNDLVFAHFLKEYFEPEVVFSTKMIKIFDKNIFMVIVDKSIKKPVICKKERKRKLGNNLPDEILLKNGTIYYRYSSSTEEIKYAELRHLLDEQVNKIFHSLVDNITLLHKVGYDRAAVVNAEELSGDNKIASVYITNDTAKNMNWIKKGHFVEEPNDGENAYYVVRQVEIKHGVEIEKPTDYNKTHPLTKTTLTKDVKISSNYIDAVNWKIGILDNPEFHVSFPHGKNKIHKFTIEAKTKILNAYPLEVSETERQKGLKQVRTEYLTYLKNKDKFG